MNLEEGRVFFLKRPSVPALLCMRVCVRAFVDARVYVRVSA